jgi:hypothetical protein
MKNQLCGIRSISELLQPFSCHSKLSLHHRKQLKATEIRSMAMSITAHGTGIAPNLRLWERQIGTERLRPQEPSSVNGRPCEERGGWEKPQYKAGRARFLAVFLGPNGYRRVIAREQGRPASLD